MTYKSSLHIVDVKKGQGVFMDDKSLSRRGQQEFPPRPQRELMFEILFVYFFSPDSALHFSLHFVAAWAPTPHGGWTEILIVEQTGFEGRDVPERVPGCALPALRLARRPQRRTHCSCPPPRSPRPPMQPPPPTRSPRPPPHAAPTPAKHAATALKTSRFFKESLPNKHTFFPPSRADANGLFRSVRGKINEPTLRLQ